MSIPILITIPGALASQLTNIKAAMDVAKARGFAGVRMSVGVGNFPFSNQSNLNVIDTTTLTSAIQYADSIGLGTVQLLFGYGPKISQLFANTFYGGTLWQVSSRPPQGSAATIGGITYASAWDYIGKVIWQQLLDAAYTHRGGLTLKVEMFNEPGKGGVGGPFYLVNGVKTYPAPYDAYHFGTIEAAWWTYALAVASVVNFHGLQTTALTFEGEQGDSDLVNDGIVDAQQEINSVTGADAIAFLALANRVATNQYASAYAAAGYSTSGMKAQFSTKLNTQLNRMQANPLIGSKPLELSEFGIRSDRVPRCIHPNSVRQDLVDQVKTGEASLSQGGLYTCFNTTSPPTAGADYPYFCYELDGTPMLYRGVAVAVTG